MPLKIMVGVKRVVDYTIQIHVQKDGSGLALDNLKMSMNPFDEIALEEAIRLKEKKIASEVIAVSIGPEKCSETLRTALAMGADKAIHVLATQSMDALTVAKIFQKIAIEISPDIIFMGKQAIDDDFNQTGQMLAGLLNWPQGTNVSELKINLDDRSILVTREVDEGQEVIQLNLPAVLTADLRLNEPRFISLLNIIKAKKQPIQQHVFDSFVLKSHSSFKILHYSSSPKRKNGVMLEKVDELIDVFQKKLGHKKDAD